MNIQSDPQKTSVQAEARTTAAKAAPSEPSQLPLFPMRLAEDLVEYWVDAGQRTAIFMDLLRQRGDEHASMTSRPLATVLKFDHEIIMSGSSFRRPINFALARVIPPPGTEIDIDQRPVVIVDPRAGQGPGIGGFHYESEIGEAFAAGHQVYFIGFSAEPQPGQTFLDVVEGQVAFFERIRDLHPDRPAPFAIGNCQAGYQTLMVAMLRPDLFGPIMLAGSPISYWQGVHGKNPMRYSGGLLGGTWLTALASDLGHGKFDGASLIGNFDTLNPGNTFFQKLYKVYSKADTEGDRFLEFEKWWGDLVLLNGEEMQYLADYHFVGNKLTANEISTPDGRLFDIRSVTSPIIVFTSLGDNISPPPQTLGWILDLYSDIEDIRRRGQTIVYCVDPGVGHLAIFVSPKVAAREDESILRMMDIIDVLPPGLYELVVTPKSGAQPGEDAVPGDFIARVEARTLDNIREFGRNSEDDDRAFATVERLSEITLATYRAFFQPFVRAASSEQSAEALREMNPVRAQYTLCDSSKPWMHGVAEAAASAREHRRPVDPDNTFLKMQEQWASLIVNGWNGYRDARDQWEEWSFFSFYGSELVQAVMGTAGGPSPSRKPPATTPAERVEFAEALEAHSAAINQGDAREAAARALLYVLSGDNRLDQRSALAIRALMLEGNDIEEVRSLVRNQFFALQINQLLAVNALPGMLPDSAEREALYQVVKKVVDASGDQSAELKQRLAKLSAVLGVESQT